jgi:hypothetical protein
MPTAEPQMAAENGNGEKRNHGFSQRNTDTSLLLAISA